MSEWRQPPQDGAAFVLGILERAGHIKPELAASVLDCWLRLKVAREGTVCERVDGKFITSKTS